MTLEVSGEIVISARVGSQIGKIGELEYQGKLFRALEV
jgi:hypothetical protein